MFRNIARFWLAVCLAVMVGSVSARAHEIRPAIVTLSFQERGTVGIELSANLEALIADIGPNHSDTDSSPRAGTYKNLRAMSPNELALRLEKYFPNLKNGITLAFDGVRGPVSLLSSTIPEVGNVALPRISVLRLNAAVPNGASAFTWQYDARFGSSVLRVREEAGAVSAIGWLKDGTKSASTLISQPQQLSNVQKFFDYVGLGFTHILPKGADHILFVLALYFLSPGLRPLLAQVTAFTVAHTITLGLGVYGVVSVSPAIVEPLIAASIVMVAVENLFTSQLSRWRPFIVFAFGLLHGLGFAGVLKEIGLPPQDFLIGLIGFNLGVELGQLTVIAAAFAVTGYWFAQREWYRGRVAMPASFVIAAIALMWTVERVMAA